VADGFAADRPEPDALRSEAASAQPPTAGARPAYYAASPGGWRDWWTLLHPPYTAWHLSYVVIGAALAPRVSLTPLLAWPEPWRWARPAWPASAGGCSRS
jgi:hypothetical protein